MKYTISSLKQSLFWKTGSRSLSNISNLNSMIQETCFEMMRQVDLPSSKRRVPFFAPLAQSPTLYMLPNDYSHNGLINVFERDYVNIRPRIRVGSYLPEFMRSLENTSLVELQDIDWVQFVNISDEHHSRSYVIDSCDDSTNGTWTAVWDVQNIRFDTAHALSGQSSLSFDGNVTSSPFGVEKSDFADTVSSTDMRYITMQMYLPVYQQNVSIRYGVDSGNYKEITLQRDWQGERFKKGWNILRFDIDNATTTGVISSDTITYFRFTIDGEISTNILGFKIDAIYISSNVSYDIQYYSSSIITNQYGERIATCLPTADSDTILLNNREYQLFVKQFAVISAIDTMVTGASNQYNAYKQDLQSDYEQFRIDYPSERMLISTPY